MREPAVTLLQRLPTIRSKLGSVIVFAVGMTLLLVYLILGVGFEVFTIGGHWGELLLAGVLGAGIALVIARWVARGMTQPLRDMAQAARRMETGDYSRRIHTDSRDEVGKLAEAFNRMSAELEGLELLRRELVANVSHELKTPISALRAHLENLLDGVEQPDPETLQIMLVQSERLGRLVDQLLELSRLESGDVPLERERVELAPLVSQVRERVHQVLFNLLDNAVRFTPTGGRVTVTASNHNGSIDVVVADTGPGIPSEHLPHVFERFYRVDESRSRDDGGTGIGLAIARSVVEAHGGRIWADSEPGRGSAFTFVLPMASPSGDPAGERSSAVPSKETRRHHG
jgi:signal transduction histidine kinase